MEHIRPIPLLKGHIAQPDCGQMFIFGLSSEDGKEEDSSSGTP